MCSSIPHAHPLFGEIVMCEASGTVQRWVFRGTDVAVNCVLTALALQRSVNEILLEHVGLPREDVAEFVSLLPFVVVALRR